MAFFKILKQLRYSNIKEWLSNKFHSLCDKSTKVSVEVEKGILNHLRYGATSKALSYGMFENFKLGYKPISSWSENHTNVSISNLQVQSKNLSKCGKINCFEHCQYFSVISTGTIQ